MELLGDLGLGFATALSPFNLLYCFVGVALGTAVGVLPGLGPIATIAMLLPITFGLPPVSSLIMLAGIYYGAQYGGSTTAILINLPGESSSVVTAIDGYQMAKKGRAGPALATAALGSFFAGTVATVLLAVAAPPLADVALEFGPAEYFSLMVLGLVASVALASGSLLKAFTMIVLGLLLGLVGSDVETGTQRFTFDMPEMADGLNFVALSMGVFGLGEILRNLEHEHTRSVMVKHVSGLMLSKADFKRIVGPVLRGTGLGSILGILPGGGAMLASFAAYSMEKKISPNGAEFGKGAIEGVAAPEVGQQRRGADLLHSDADARHPVEPGHGADDRRDDHPGHHARPECRDRRAGAVLGHDRVDVGRQSAAGAAQPAADRALDTDADDPVSPAVPGHHRLLLHRRVQRQQQHLRRLHDGVVRTGRLRADQAGFRAGAPAARFRAGADAGGKPAPRHAAQPGRCHGVRDAAAQPGSAAGFLGLLAVVLLPNIRSKREEAFSE